MFTVAVMIASRYNLCTLHRETKKILFYITIAPCFHISPKLWGTMYTVCTEMAMLEYQGLYFCLSNLLQLGPKSWSLSEATLLLHSATATPALSGAGC